MHLQRLKRLLNGHQHRDNVVVVVSVVSVTAVSLSLALLLALAVSLANPTNNMGSPRVGGITGDVLFVWGLVVSL